MNISTNEHTELEKFVITENCIIAEVYRLAKLMPKDFLNPTSSQFSKLIVDFSYFENKALLDKYVEGSEVGI